MKQDDSVRMDQAPAGVARAALANGLPVYRQASCSKRSI